MPAFVYPTTPLTRKHGPAGYSNYISYRQWLRDEFTFRCIYCLIREQWGRVTSEFDLDHFLPQTTNVGLVTAYDNLVYSCARCNAIKSSENVPDPTLVLTDGNLRLQPDGSLESYSDDAEALILKLDLNSPEMVAWRLLWMRITELASLHDAGLAQRILGFPENLPNLSKLRPPAGNTRPQGIAKSYFALAALGALPSTY